MVLVSASVLSANFLNFKSEILSVKNVDRIHVDVIDGIYAENITFGAHVMHGLRKCTDKPIDVHLMVSDMSKKLWLISDFAKIGATSISFHPETTDQPHIIIEHIHRLGIDAGMCINPDIQNNFHKDFLNPLLSYVVVMSVYPGFANQKFIPSSLETVRHFKKKVPRLQVLIDGGINENTSSLAIDAGADILVAGSYIFSRPSYDRPSAINRLRCPA